MRTLRLAAAASLVIKLFLALFTTGTNDSITWDRDVAVFRSAGPVELYRHGVQFPTSAGNLGPRQEFIHPPAVLHGLSLLGVLQEKTGLPPHVWLRIACSFADTATLLLLWLMFRGEVHKPALVLVALSPISILVSGFHGNSDPIMMCFVVLSILQVQKKRAGWAGVAFGLSLAVKLIPVIFVPAILLSLPGTRERLKWIAATALTWAAASLPWLIESPELILRTITGYNSATGLWGFELFARVLKYAGHSMLYEIYTPGAKWIALIAVVLAPMILRYYRYRLTLFAQCGLVASVFLFLSPGFGLQYLAWTVPWVVVLEPRVIVRYFLMAGVFMLGTYTEAAWANGRKIFADLLLPGNWHVLIGMGIVCWIGMGVMIRCYSRSEQSRAAI